MQIPFDVVYFDGISWRFSQLPMRGCSGQIYFGELVLELSSRGAGGDRDRGRVVTAVLICSHSLAVSQAVVGLTGREGPAVHVVRHRRHRRHRGGLDRTDHPSSVPAMPGGVQALNFTGLISPSTPAARFVVGLVVRLVVMPLLAFLVVLVSVMRLAMPSSHKYRVVVAVIFPQISNTSDALLALLFTA